MIKIKVIYPKTISEISYIINICDKGKLIDNGITKNNYYKFAKYKNKVYRLEIKNKNINYQLIKD